MKTATIYFTCAIAVAVNGCVRSPQDQMKKVVQRIQSRTQYVDVQPANLIFDSGPQPLMQYVLTLSGRPEESQNAAYLFDSQQYTLDDFGGTPEEVPTSEICALIDSISDYSGPLDDALGDLKASGTVKISPLGPSLEINLEGRARTLIDFYYAVNQMLTLRSVRAEVLVRGFADGELDGWQEKLDSTYNYTSVEVMPPLDAAAPIAFRRTRVRIPLPEPPKYSNGDLPNLRARYVKEVLLDPYLANCPSNTPATSAILQGFAYKEASRPLDRKVQVYLLFYERG
jgi:hypothetical protein